MKYEHEKPEREAGLKAISAPYPAYDPRLEEMAEAYLVSRNISLTVAQMNRCYPSSSVDGVPRLVLPATNSAGSGYWQARAMVEAPTRYQSPRVYRGDSLIVMWPAWLIVDAPVVVVEGPFDALAAASTGLVGVALMGAKPPSAVLDYLGRFLQRSRRIIVADLDEQAAAVEVATQLSARGNTCAVVFPAPYKDLCAAPVEFRAKLLGRML